MGKHPGTGLAIVAVAAGTVLVAGAGPAFADASSPLYVNNTAGANCTDSGAGTQTQPFCTISAATAAVASGQTINVAGGTYSEHVTIAKSGTAGQPITLQHLDSRTVQLTGANAGFTVDGQHDVSINGFSVTGVASGPGIALSNSTRLALQNITVQAAPTATVVGVRLAAVTDSSLVGVRSLGTLMPTGVALDAATTRVLLKSVVASMNYAAGSTGIDIAGSANTVVNSNANRAGVAGILLEPGAADNVVANTSVSSGNGVGIANAGATGTAITSNTVTNNCAAGIRVSGASSGVSVQNNVTAGNVASRAGCDPSIADAVEIGVYDGAMGRTVVDYNCVLHQSAPGDPAAYAWSTPMSLVAFRAASGQAAHDKECPLSADRYDSANSAAPGFQSTDTLGRPREDDPSVPNTGAGPVTYADRGSTENIQGPGAQIVVTVDQHALSITADASTTTPGWVPIVSYAFDFGDGSTVTQATPVAAHHYAKVGYYVVTVTVTDANAISGASSSGVQLWTAARMKVDFNGDGKVDVAGIDANGDLRLYTGDGAGKVNGGNPMSATGGLWARDKHLAAADFNNDGKTDVAYIDAANDLHLNTGDGTGKLIAAPPMWPTGALWAGFKHIVAGDFNADGNIDVAGIDANNDLRLYTGDGTGQLTGTGPAMWPTGGLWAGFKHIVAGDFNNDGNVDIAGIDANNDLRLYTGNGAGKLTGTGTAMWPTGGLWAGFKHIVAGDFNADGNVDVAGIDANNDLRLYTGNGAGKLTGTGTAMWPTGGLWAGFKQLT
ncbi:FG-GAP-like repeat-containing protein [Dactylosporangium sp. CA-139066]|uniref:FG-GAP-like repeat-containing protein n=1 Tax=Dactylosporangium sp. CA-139066 TaxID=3239930 RepID=UPI003D8F231F